MDSSDKPNGNKTSTLHLLSVITNWKTILQQAGFSFMPIYVLYFTEYVKKHWITLTFSNVYGYTVTLCKGITKQVTPGQRDVYW